MAKEFEQRYGVSVITCTNRPDFFGNILDNYHRQQYHSKELIVILNKNSMNLRKCRRRARKYPDVTVYKVSESTSLGTCLNHAVIKSRYALIAKFDDDDYYSPYYLDEQINALIKKRSDVVGKNACLVYLEATNRLIINNPKLRHRFIPFLQGGTLLFRRSVFSKVHFADVSLGEDVTFLKMCQNRGFRIHATSPYNYVYIRRKNKNSHTWQVNDYPYSFRSLTVSKTNNFRPFARRKEEFARESNLTILNDECLSLT